MNKEEISNNSALVYYISNNSKTWTLQNPYFIALRSLLTGKIEDQRNLRIQQEFHFIAKVIYDELRNDGRQVMINTRKISDIIKSYLSDRNQKHGDEVLRLIFYVLVMKFLDKGRHYRSLDQTGIKKFLSSYKTDYDVLKSFQRISSLVYSVTQQEADDESNSNLSLALDLLYNRLLFNDGSKREKASLVDYYVKQTTLEKIDLTQLS